MIDLGLHQLSFKNSVKVTLLISGLVMVSEIYLGLMSCLSKYYKPFLPVFQR